MHTERPFRPVRRARRIAIAASMVFAALGDGSSRNSAPSVFVFGAVFALALGVGCLLYRQDIAAVVRARREG